MPLISWHWCGCRVFFPGRIHNDTKQIVAIKQIDLEDSDDDIGEIQQEIAHLAQCDSEYVTRYYGSFVKGYKLWISSLLLFALLV